MSIEVRCEHCGKSVKVKDSLSGSRGLCPYCKSPIEVPQVTVAVSADVVDRILSPTTEKLAPPVFTEAPVATPSRSDSEETIYSDQDVSVTTTRVLCSGTTYALRNITSVKMGMTPPSRVIALVMLILGVMFLPSAVFGGSVGSALIGLLGAAFFIGLGVWLWRLSTPYYHLAVSSSSGEVQAYT